ncbi:MAG: acylphosphatase [Planctomycetota bacterium]
MTATRFTITFRGRVQGVFFRATTRDLSERFAVTGWVRNEPDGSVVCVAEGEQAELDRFIAAVREAKRGNIDDVTIDRSAATGEFSAFDIRR